jgi:hypothetical protein
MKPLVWRDLAQATMLSKWLRIIAATSFMGSTPHDIGARQGRSSSEEAVLKHPKKRFAETTAWLAISDSNFDVQSERSSL